MSCPKFRLELSDRARRDFRDILSYTLQMWGDRQLAEYQGKIDSALSAITQNPHAGREKAGSVLRVFRVGRHLIFYRIDGVTVYVVRILHDQMDIDSHLDV